MKRLKKRLFARYEYHIGLGEFDRLDINWWGQGDKYYFDNKEYRTHIFSYYFTVCLAVGFGLLLPAFFAADAPWWLCIEISTLPIMCAYLATDETTQKAIDLQKRLRKVPEHIKQGAKIMYGRNWRESALECYEAHIAGDCPICGAV